MIGGKRPRGCVKRPFVAHFPYSEGCLHSCVSAEYGRPSRLRTMVTVSTLMVFRGPLFDARPRGIVGGKSRYGAVSHLTSARRCSRSICAANASPLRLVTSAIKTKRRQTNIGSRRLGAQVRGRAVGSFWALTFYGRPSVLATPAFRIAFPTAVALLPKQRAISLYPMSFARSVRTTAFSAAFNISPLPIFRGRRAGGGVTKKNKRRAEGQ